MDLRRLVACAIWLKLGRCCRCYRKLGKCNHVPVAVSSVEGDSELITLDVPLNPDDIREPTIEFLAELEAAELEDVPKTSLGDINA